MMRWLTIKIAVSVAIVAIATMLAAEGLDEDSSVVEGLAAIGLAEFNKAVKQADADYFKRLDPLEGRLRMGRYKSVEATFKKTAALLKSVAGEAKKAGADIDAGIAKKQIIIIEEYLDETKAAVPKELLVPPSPVKTVRKLRPVNTAAARTRFGRHSYLVILRAVTWDEASAMAKSHGGHLAYVESAEEQLFLRRIVTTRAWVGGAFHGDRRQWEWGNDKKISRLLWKGSPPRGSSRSCTALEGDGLSTQDRTRKMDAFVVEWDR